MAKKKFYFDYASTTPLDPRVFRTMKPFFTHKFGNPANLYELGRGAKSAVDRSLFQISSVLGCVPQEFIFTSSATESDNLAILGIARANKERGNRIIISNVEHKGIAAACAALAKEGFEIAELKAGQDGLVRPDDLKKLLNKKTILISVTYADNETGTAQPIKELTKIVENFRRNHNRTLPYFHTDATQAVLYLNVDVRELGVDLMTISAHKIYGPLGIGGLFVRRGVKIEPIIYGGGQQGRLRSGTDNIPAIGGFGAAMELLQRSRGKESERVKKLRDRLQRGIFKSIPKVVLNGHPTRRLPNFLNISILDIEGEAAVLYLDARGIFVNTGSACNSQSLEPSRVLLALGRPYEYAHGSLRFSLGKRTTVSDVDYVIKHLPGIVAKLRRISPINLKPGEEREMSQPIAFVGGNTPHFLRKNLFLEKINEQKK